MRYIFVLDSKVVQPLWLLTGLENEYWYKVEKEFSA